MEYELRSYNIQVEDRVVYANSLNEAIENIEYEDDGADTAHIDTRPCKWVKKK